MNLRPVMVMLGGTDQRPCGEAERHRRARGAVGNQHVVAGEARAGVAVVEPEFVLALADRCRRRLGRGAVGKGEPGEIVVLHEGRAGEVHDRGDAAHLVGNAAQVGQGDGGAEGRREVAERRAGRRADHGELRAGLVDHPAIDQGGNVLDGVGRRDARTGIGVLAEIVGLQQLGDLEVVHPEIPQRIVRCLRIGFLAVRRLVLRHVRHDATGEQAEDRRAHRTARRSGRRLDHDAMRRLRIGMPGLERLEQEVERAGGIGAGRHRAAQHHAELERARRRILGDFGEELLQSGIVCTGRNGHDGTLSSLDVEGRSLTQAQPEVVAFTH